jgi:folate-binding protein YgfZ
MSSLDHVGYWATKHSVAVFQTSRDFIIAEGPDTLEYLQGQLTQDIAALAPGGSTWSFLLEPDGKVNALLRVTRLEPFDARIGEDGVNVERVILDFDSGFVDQVLSRLNRFKLRTSVEFLELNWECLSLRGPLSEEKLHEIGKVGDFTVVRYLAGGLFGFDLLGEHFDVPPSLSWCGKDDYEALLVETGAVRMGKEIDKRTIPQEIGDVHFAVSFNKGCYTGQELMARLDARGNNVARRLRGVVFEAVPSSKFCFYRSPSNAQSRNNPVDV